MNFIEMKRSNQLYFDHIQQIWKVQLNLYDELFYFDVKDNELFLTMKEDEIYQTHLIPKLSPHLTTTGTTKEILSTIEILSSLQECQELLIHSYDSIFVNDRVYFTFSINNLPYKFKLIFIDFSILELSARSEHSSSFYPIHLSSLEHFFDQETLNRIKNFFFQHSEYRVRLLFKQTYSNIGKLNI